MKKAIWIILILNSAVNAQTIRNVPGSYPTIASAISAANPGDIIKIESGTYAEQLVIQKDLTIVGAGKNSTLIQESPAIHDSTALFIDNAVVYIRDLQINGFENTDGRRRGIVSLNSALTIRQCNFVMLSNAALAVVNGSLDADSLLITCINSGSNTAIVDSGQYGNGVGIYLDNGIMLMNAHFTINHLTAGASINHIIDIYPNSNNYVLNIKYPVDLSQHTVGTIENSTLYGELDFAYGQAIRVFGDLARPEGAAELIIRNNRIKGLAVDSSLVVPNRWDCAGICFSGANGFGEIYGNSIQYFNAGISVYGYSTANIHDNIIMNNARYGIITSWGGGAYSGAVDLGGGVYNSPGRNVIHGNGQYDVMNKNSLQVWALHNDWGTTDIEEIGAKIFDQADNVSVGIVSYDVNTFPVELTYFSAIPKASSVILNWNTATEVNNYGFEIERLSVISNRLSVNENPDKSGQSEILQSAKHIKNHKSGIQNLQSAIHNPQWESVGFVPGYGNSNSPKDYTFEDKNLEGSSYKYRLKQIDNDGKYQYSEEILVYLKSSYRTELVQNYPNPFNLTTVIKFALEKESIVKLKIFDILGKEINELVNKNIPAGQYTIYWNGTNRKDQQVSSGVYIYQLIVNDQVVNTRKMNLLK